MPLPKSVTTITPISKLLAMLLFILFPFLGFYLGMKYTKMTIQYVPVDTVVKVPASDSRATLVLRCGDIPGERLGITQGHFTILNGPDWSPDCRHIAWSSWQSGTGTIYTDESMKYTGPFPFEGIFLYTDATEKVQRIVTPKFGETLIFEGWKDRNTIRFSRQSTTGKEGLTYDLPTGTITSIPPK